MAAATEDVSVDEVSVFQTKYDEFADELLGVLPEYETHIRAALALDESTRLARFQAEVKVANTFGAEESATDYSKNPGTILPGVIIADSVWSTLSENTRKAMWEHVRVLSMCCFFEAGFTEGATPPVWMDDAMNEMKKTLDGIDFDGLAKKFATFFKSSDSGREEERTAAGGAGASAAEDSEGGLPKGLEGLFGAGFPKIPEKFLKGHLAKLAQEIVKDITPDDLGFSPEMIADCEKSPSRAFDILFSTFTKNPGLIQKTVQKIGKRLQQKIVSGSIRPQEIAREAEELMKEFAGNSSFVEMMEGLKGAFGFEDMGMAKQAGREGSARLAMVKDRLKKKLEAKKAGKK
jgi:hypothetical protein